MNLEQHCFDLIAKLDNATIDEIYRARKMCLECANDFAVSADIRVLFGRMADLIYKCMSRDEWVRADRKARGEGRSDSHGI